MLETENQNDKLKMKHEMSRGNPAFFIGKKV